MKSGFNISIVIPTKDRANLLEECLISLVNQTRKIGEIIIIDSSKNDHTRELARTFTKKLPIKYRYQKASGYPAAYNFGIKSCSNRWVGFLNDDTTVSKRWHAEVLKTIEKYPNCVIQGKSVSVPGNNIYAEVMGDHYKNWVSSHLMKNNHLDTFDAKCSIMPKNMFFKKKKFAGFDERLVKGSEDIEMGQRLVKQGKEILYYPKIVIYHKERTTLNGFIMQHLRIAQAEGALTSDTLHGNVSLFPGKKTLLNLKSFIYRELKYLKKFDIVNAVYLPFLYFLLFWVRVFGYTLRR